MAAINCNVQAPWNDRKYYRFARTGYEFHSHLTPVKEDDSHSGKNVKHETSHISSDGYYACLPAVPFMDDYAMDTNDVGAENSMENGRDPKNESCISALTDMPVLNENVVSVEIALRRRKRINDEYATAEPKRQRHEGNLIKFLTKSAPVSHFVLKIFACSDGFSLGALKWEKRKEGNCLKTMNETYFFILRCCFSEFCGLTPCQVKVLPTTRSFDAHYQRCIMGHYV